LVLIGLQAGRLFQSLRSCNYAGSLQLALASCLDALKEAARLSSEVVFGLPGGVVNSQIVILIFFFIML